MNNLIFILLIWNISVMLIYCADKIKARRNSYRISEGVLMLCAFFFGGLGAMFGMIVFNHKTAKIKFRIFVPLFTILEFVFLLFCIQ